MGRDSLFGPDSITFNPSLQKLTKLSERYTVQFRAEFFNVFNRPNYANPGFPALQEGSSSSLAGVAQPDPTPDLWADRLRNQPDKWDDAANPIWIEAALLREWGRVAASERDMSRDATSTVVRGAARASKIRPARR